MNSHKEKDKHPFCVFSFQEVRTHTSSLHPGELDSVLLKIRNQKRRDVRKACNGCNAEPPQRGTTLPSVSHFMQEVTTIPVSSKDARTTIATLVRKPFVSAASLQWPWQSQCRRHPL